MRPSLVEVPNFYEARLRVRLRLYELGDGDVLHIVTLRPSDGRVWLCARPEGATGPFAGPCEAARIRGRGCITHCDFAAVGRPSVALRPSLVEVPNFYESRLGARVRLHELGGAGIWLCARLL